MANNWNIWLVVFEYRLITKSVFKRFRKTTLFFLLLVRQNKLIDYFFLGF